MKLDLERSNVILPSDAAREDFKRGTTVYLSWSSVSQNGFFFLPRPGSRYPRQAPLFTGRDITSQVAAILGLDVSSVGGITSFAPYYSLDEMSTALSRYVHGDNLSIKIARLK